MFKSYSSKPGCRLVLVDDHRSVREGLRAGLKEMQHEAVSQIEIVGEAGNAAEALALAGQVNPDLMLIDITMKGMNGIRLTEELGRRHPAIRVLILSMHDQREYVTSALHAGASGYVLKEAGLKDIIAAIDVVIAGGTYCSPSITRLLLDLSPLDKLTKRERETGTLIVLGFCNKKISHRLGIGVRAVETHRLNLRRKLNVNSTAELTKLWIERGLISVDDLPGGDIT